MIKASSLKNGSIVEIDGVPHVVEQLSVQTPSARGGASFYKVRFRNVATKQKLDRSFKGDDALNEVRFEKKDVQFSYQDGDRYVFMDLDDYSEIALSESDLARERPYLTEDLEGIRALVSNGKILGLELPSAVELKITECEPSMRGASAQARTKPATLAGGLVVQVPEYLAPGEVIRVDTRTGEFLGRTGSARV